MEHFLDACLLCEGPAYCGWYHHWAGGPGLSKPVSSVSPWPLLQFLPQVPSLTSLPNIL